jgi:hypothetical protein
LIREVTLRGHSSTDRHNMLRALTYLRAQSQADVFRSCDRRLPSLRVSLHDWSNPSVSALSFDRLFRSVEREGDFRLVLVSADWLIGSQDAMELLNRYQRLLALPMDAQLPAYLAGVLALYREAFPPEVDRTYARHASGIDTWRWLLRLTPGASAELQLAALFHDLPVHELETVLEPLELERRTLLRAAELGAFYDHPTRGRDFACLRRARAVSFFAHESWAYLRDHGFHATRLKIQRLMPALDSAALCAVLTTRQPDFVSEVIETVSRSRRAKLSDASVYLQSSPLVF